MSGDYYLHDQARALRATLGIPETATHDEAIKRARRIAYEAETARLIEDHITQVTDSAPLWVARSKIDTTADPDLHIAVRAAAGKEES